MDTLKHRSLVCKRFQFENVKNVGELMCVHKSRD